MKLLPSMSSTPVDSRFLLAAVLCFGLVFAAAAEPEKNSQKKRVTETKAKEPAVRKKADKTAPATEALPKMEVRAKTKPTAVTGSNIKKKLRRTGRLVDTASPVVVIDRDDLDQSGASTVGEVLRRFPFIR